MKEEDTGAIPVLDEDELVGIITDRDIVVRCIAEGKDATETNVEDILSESLVTIEPDADIEVAARLMSERQIRRLPVVEDGLLVGVLSLGDIAVKEFDDQPANEALEGVSRGVKVARGQRQQPQGQRKSKFGKTQLASRVEQEEIEEEITEYSNAGRGEDWRSEDRRGGKRRARFGASKEQPRKGAKSTRGGGREAGGISNRSLPQETSRQKKVTSARREAKTGRRRAS